MANEELNERIVALTDEELAAVSGGKTYIEGDDGKSHVRTGPGLHYKSIGILHRGEDAQYLHESAPDERAVMWYKIKWKGQEAWVSSMYTKKVRY